MENSAPFESVTKLEAAERQLRVAIRSFFEGKDLIAVHTLAAAAQEVLRDLGRPRGIKSIFKGSDRIRPEKTKEINAIFNEAQNFFKHADRDPSENLKFHYEATKYYLLDAALLYNQLTGRQFPEMTGLICWFLLKFPDLLGDDPYLQAAVQLAKGVNADDLELLLAAVDQLARQQSRL